MVGTAAIGAAEQMFLPTRKEEGKQKLPIWEDWGGIQKYLRKALPTLEVGFPL